MERARILFIESDVNSQTFMRKLLSESGYKVDVANHLAMARHFLGEAREGLSYDVIISDSQLADGNGLEFLVEQLQVHPESRAVLTTDREDLEPCIQAAEDFDIKLLEKPFSPQKLLQYVGPAMGSELTELVS